MPPTALRTALLSFGLAACIDGDKGGDSGASAASGDMAQAFVDAHNAVREGVGVPALSWSDALGRSAGVWAQALADNDCAFEHDTQQEYGENLWWSSWDPTADEVVGAWADEVAFYDYDSNTCEQGQMCGHYTQVVWSTTERVGCGKAVCAGGEVIWNCRYDPPGNWVGERPY